MFDLLKVGEKICDEEIEIVDKLGRSDRFESYLVALSGTEVGQIFVLKCFYAQSSDDRASGQLLGLQEKLQKLIAVGHPSFIRTERLCLGEPLPFLIEEFIAGGSLKDLIASRKIGQAKSSQIFSASELTTIALQLGSALEHIHMQNIQHLAIRTSQIYVRDMNRLEIALGGMSLEPADQCESDEEEIEGSASAERLAWFDGLSGVARDLFDLGLCLYEAASGTVTVTEGELSKLQSRVSYKALRPLDEIFVDFPPLLAQVIGKLLSRDRAYRYDSARRLNDDLELVRLELALDFKLRDVRTEAPFVDCTREDSPPRLGGFSQFKNFNTVIAEKISELNQFERDVLCISSIAERSISRGALSYLWPLLSMARQQSMSGTVPLQQKIELSYQYLLQRNLLSPDPDHFIFVHGRIGEHAYALLSDEEKKLLHHYYGAYCVSAINRHKQAIQDQEIFEAAHHLCLGDPKSLSLDLRELLLLAARAAKRNFAYEKAQHYLSAILDGGDARCDMQESERLAVLEILADILAVSDQVVAALAIYDQLLGFKIDPLKKAKIFAKKVEYCLSIFDYKSARIACEEALQLLGKRLITNDVQALIYILMIGPFLLLYAFYFRLFGKQNRVISSEIEEVEFQILIKSEISQYFTQPILTVANLIPVTFRLLPYRDNSYRALIFCYWGVIFATLGMKAWSDRFFSRAIAYFDCHENPVEKGFALFSWAISLDFPRGDLVRAEEKLNEAIVHLERVGESFWRLLSAMALVYLDYYGAESGGAQVHSSEVEKMCRKSGIVATPLSGVLRHNLEQGDDSKLKDLIQESKGGLQALEEQGYDTMDKAYACLALADYYDLVGDDVEAEKYALAAFKLCLFRHYRPSILQFGPVLLARQFTKKKSLFKASLVLAVAWTNQALAVYVWRSQTYFETGRWLFAAGLPYFGRMALEAGIAFAQQRQQKAQVAEGRLILGQMIAAKNPEQALVLVTLARNYFHERNWFYHELCCDRNLHDLHLLPSKADQSIGLQSSEGSLQRNFGLRQQVEVQTLMGMLIKLNAIGEPDALHSALLESLCNATGSELALLYMKHKDEWQIRASYPARLDELGLLQNKIDRKFLNSALARNPSEALIRGRKDLAESGSSVLGSVMLTPLLTDGIIYGYCYLGNSQLSDLFDQRSVDIAGPITTQAAICLQNMQLSQELAIERDEISKLHRTLEMRVIEQTRNIRSIMQHIGMGICTISGEEIRINKEYSIELENILGLSQLEGQELLTLLFHGSELTEDERDQVKQVLLTILDEGELAFETNAHLLPRTLTVRSKARAQKFLELNWMPIIGDDERVERVLFAVNDVTELRGLEAVALEKNEQLLIISEILGCSPTEWAKFLDNARSLLERGLAEIDSTWLQLGAETSIRQVLNIIHTLKGNARGLGLKQLNNAIHSVEQFFADSLGEQSLKVEQKLARYNFMIVEQTLNEYERIASEKLSRSGLLEETITIARAPLLQLYQCLQKVRLQGKLQANDLQAVMGILQKTLYTSMDMLLNSLGRELGSIAHELEKLPPSLVIDVPTICLARSTEDSLRNFLVHILRNSLDHGLESPGERVAQGKDPQGALSFVGHFTAEWFEMTVEDDGRGLNLDRLRSIGLAKKTLSQQDSENSLAIAELIFQNDLSTSEQSNDISGRGVGMAAVRESIVSIGGSILIRLHQRRKVTPGFAAFDFLIRLPLFLFQKEIKRKAS